MAGYIKLHRKLTEWEWYSDPNTLRVFLHLLLKASYKETRYRGHPIHPGQVVCGRKALARELKMSERSVRTALAHLKSTNEVTIKTTSKFSVITIEKWALYQGYNYGSDQQNDQQAVQQTTSNRPHSRNIEGKKREGGRAPRTRKNDLEESYAMMEDWANDEN